MQKVFVDEMFSWVMQARNLLEDADIPCFIKNEFSGNVAGEVPFLETWPELWVHRDSDVNRAMDLLKPLRASRKADEKQLAVAEDWRCPGCGETNEGQFALCWSCGLVAEMAP
ncbi:DUF2007 domain-containing protein [Marinicella sediminis]|uniref:DUF2007 domain-containing protein n=1 Tax=Marinicella sediminis TaxID=1792834 RepID=A0ABV7JDI7_9GAMM|nr:DUF2007 domain-containing protein [Marinicella sediminis]